MKLHRTFPLILLVAFVVSTFTQSLPAKAQGQSAFDGTIAYINSTGNIVLARGDGSQIQITQDGSLRIDMNDNNYINYNCLKFSPDGRYLYFDRAVSLSNGSSDFAGVLYDVQKGVSSKLFDGKDVPYTGCGPRWLSDKNYSFLSAELETLKTDAVGDPELYKEKVYREYISGEKELLFDVVTTGIGFAYGDFVDEQNKTVTYKVEDPQLVDILNWETGKSNQIKLPSDFYAFDVDSESPDGKLIFLSDHSNELHNPIITIDIQSGQSFPWKVKIDDTGSLRWSPDSRQILGLTSDCPDGANCHTSFYFVDPYGKNISPAFELDTPSDDSLYSDWSLSGKYILISEIPSNLSSKPSALLLSTNLNQPSVIAPNAEEMFWINEKNERLIFVQRKPNGNSDFSRELDSYDPQSGDAIKIGDLQSLNAKNVPGNPYLFEVAWTSATFDFPAAPQTSSPTTPIPPTGQLDSQVATPFSFPNVSYLVACGLCLILLLILAILIAIFLNRSRQNKRSHEKNEDRSETPHPISPNEAQINQAIELAKSKHYQEAFEMLRQIVQSEPNNASAWFNLGGVLADMGNFKDAERCYFRAKQLGHPKADEALNWLKQKRQ